MKADEILVLLLIVICVGGIGVLEIRSSAGQYLRTLEAPEAATDAATVSTSSANVTQSGESRRRSGNASRSRLTSPVCFAVRWWRV
jgi:hypothetical protein